MKSISQSPLRHIKTRSWGENIEDIEMMLSRNGPSCPFASIKTN